MDYKIYAPAITTTTVIDTYNDPAGLTYVSNSSLVYWQGRFWAIMDGTTQGFTEGSTGQQIWLATSVDGQTWTTAVQPFRDAAHCNNPVSGSSLEWQPNLVVVGDELWCTWCATTSTPLYTTYVSKLADPEGKWTNYRFEYSGTDLFESTTITGAATGSNSLSASFDSVSDWAAFPSQNPIVLSSGVVACPVTLVSKSTLSTQTTSTSTQIRRLKTNALFQHDESGWSMTLVDTSDFGDFCAWEPFVVENPVGHVYFYSRSLNMTSPDEDFMLVAVSYDGGATFSPSVSTKLLVPSTRGFARQVGRRLWIMAHVDCPQGSTQDANQTVSQNRINGALFVSRRGVDDFVPGVNFSGKDNRVNYPQFDVFDGHLYVNYTSQDGNPIRRSLKVVKIPLPDDQFAHVHPRSVTIYNPESPTDPALQPGPPAYYEFLGGNQMVSTTALAATTGVTYAAWLRFNLSGEVIADARGFGTENFGQTFRLRGITINALNFLHANSLPTDTVIFTAAVVDNATQTVTLYLASGSGFSTTTGHYRSVLFTGQPADGNTLTVDGVAYTFRTTASLPEDIQIGATTSSTVSNAVTVLQAHSISVGRPASGLRLLLARSDIGAFTVSSGSAQITVESGIPLDGGSVSVGMPGIASSLTAFSGDLFDCRIYDDALSLDEVTYLHNEKATGFGYSDIAGTASAPTAPLIQVDATAPDPVEFVPLGAAAYCEKISDDTLRIHGEASAAVELPYGSNDVVIQFKLGAMPAGWDKYVIASFGNAESPLRLFINGTNPTQLWVGGRAVLNVPTPTGWNVVTVRVSTNKIMIGSFEQYFSGKPRCYLGNAFPEELLPASKYVDFDVSAMTVERPLNEE